MTVIEVVMLTLLVLCIFMTLYCIIYISITQEDFEKIDTKTMDNNSTIHRCEKNIEAINNILMKHGCNIKEIYYILNDITDQMTYLKEALKDNIKDYEIELESKRHKETVKRIKEK